MLSSPRVSFSRDQQQMLDPEEVRLKGPTNPGLPGPELLLGVKRVDFLRDPDKCPGS